jgi:hypothetical protein
VIRIIADWVALLGGVRPPRRRTLITGVLLGVWWVVLFAVVFATIGRATKFIYVDF